MIKNPETKIKRIRELKNISQEYLATKMDISIRAYSKIESGETQLTVKRLNEISTLLEISPLEILTFDESQLFTVTAKDQNNATQHLVELYKKRTEHLESEIFFLRKQLANKTA